MIVAGALLVLFAVGMLLTALFGGSNDPARLSLGPVDLDISVTGVFLVGCATVLVFVMGLELLRSGARRGVRRRRERKQLVELSKKLDRVENEQRSTGDEDPPGR